MTIFAREAVRAAAISLPGAATTTSYDDARAKAADTFARRKYGRSRKDIDDFINQHYHSHGPYLDRPATRHERHHCHHSDSPVDRVTPQTLSNP